MPPHFAVTDDVTAVTIYLCKHPGVYIVLEGASRALS